MPLVGVFRCLELCLYGIRELAGASNISISDLISDLKWATVPNTTYWSTVLGPTSRISSTILSLVWRLSEPDTNIWKIQTKVWKGKFCICLKEQIKSALLWTVIEIVFSFPRYVSLGWRESVALSVGLLSFFTKTLWSSRLEIQKKYDLTKFYKMQGKGQHFLNKILTRGCPQTGVNIVSWGTKSLEACPHW